MTRPKRTGLRGRPDDGWPLDRLLVSVASLRATRELFLQQARDGEESLRAWDLSLWSGVSPQGAASALKRLERLSLVEAREPSRPDRARGYRLVPGHPLASPLARLFDAEHRMVPRPRPFARPRRPDPR